MTTEATLQLDQVTPTGKGKHFFLNLAFIITLFFFRDTQRDLREPAKVNEPLEPVFEPRPNPDSDNETIDPKNRRRRESGRSDLRARRVK